MNSQDSIQAMEFPSFLLSAKPSPLPPFNRFGRLNHQQRTAVAKSTLVFFFSSLQLCFITAFKGLSNPKYIFFLWSLVLIIHPDWFVVSCSYWLYRCLPSFQYNRTKRHYHYYYYATNIYSLMSSWRGLWQVLWHPPQLSCNTSYPLFHEWCRKKIVLHATSYNNFCGLSRVTGLWLLERDIVVKFLKCVISFNHFGEKGDKTE